MSSQKRAPIGGRTPSAAASPLNAGHTNEPEPPRPDAPGAWTPNPKLVSREPAGIVTNSAWSIRPAASSEARMMPACPPKYGAVAPPIVGSRFTSSGVTTPGPS